MRSRRDLEHDLRLQERTVDMEERTKRAFETLIETTGGLEKVVQLQDRALDIFAEQNKAERQAREVTEKRLYDLIKWLVVALIATGLGKEVVAYFLGR